MSNSIALPRREVSLSKAAASVLSRILPEVHGLRVAVRNDHALERKIEHCAEGWQISFFMSASTVPDPEFAITFGQRVPEDDRP